MREKKHNLTFCTQTDGHTDGRTDTHTYGARFIVPYRTLFGGDNKQDGRLYVYLKLRFIVRL